jgi:hypothetical protein
MLARIITVPGRKTWTTPARSRRTIVRNVIASTRPPGAVHHGDVSNAHLVLQHDEEPADHVPDEVLRAEAHGLSAPVLYVLKAPK